MDRSYKTESHPGSFTRIVKEPCMPSHQLDYEILGASAQSVEMIVDRGETVIAEAGVMNYMTDGIRFETRMGDGSASGVLGKLWGMGKRMLTGESLFMTHFSNAGKTPARLAFAHAGGTVIRKELNNETLRLDTGCLVAFTSGIDYDIALAGGLKSMLFGGEGILLATLKGTGTVWVQSLPFSRLAERIYEATFKAREEVRAGGNK